MQTIVCCQVTKSFLSALGMLNDSHGINLLFYHYIDGGGPNASSMLTDAGPFRPRNNFLLILPSVRDLLVAGHVGI